MKRWLIAIFLFIISILGSILATPSVNFISPTPDGNVSGNYIYVNLSTSGAEHYSFVDFDSDLLLWMRQDDRNSTHVYDNSSYENPGSIENGANFISGRFGEAFNGDGYDNYIRVEDSSDFDALANKDTMTVCAWVKQYSNSNTWGTNQGVLGQYWASGIYNYNRKSFAIAEGIAGNNKYALYVSPDGSSWQDAQSNSNFSLNTWYHICGTVGGGYSRFFVNGVQQTDTGTVSQIYNPINTPFTIGTYFYSANTSKNSTLFYNGSIDEVLLFSRNLSLNEIQAVYNASAYRFANNYTGLANTSHSFTGYGVDSGVDSVSRTIYTGVIEEENDTINPLIDFVSPTEDDESNLSRDYLMVNVSASDDNLENITIYLYDEDSLVDSDTSASSPNFANFTGLSNGTYYFNATAYDSYGNNNSSATRNVVVAYTQESNETNETMLPGINITCSHLQVNNFSLTLTTNASADSCWFVDNATNTTMLSLNSTSFYYDSIGAGLHNLTFYCNNSNGTANASDSFEFRKYANFYDSHFTNSQGLEIYFDFNYNYTEDGGILIITSDTWSSDKDSSTLVDAENKYMPRGYAVASVETRGKGSSQGSPDAYGYCCVDIYDLAQYILSNSNYSQYVNASKGVYLTGASGAGGRTGVCTAKYPDFFVSGHTTVGVLNLTLWWYTAAQSDVDEIENRVGCNPIECPEAYQARDAGYLGFNTLSPMSVEHPIDDTRVTVNCSRNYNASLVYYNKTVNYTEPSSGGHRAEWTPSYAWFENHTLIPILPSSGDLRIGGFVHTKNFSIFLDESNVNHMAYVNYDISGNNKIFNLTTESFNGEVNFTVFDLVPNSNYTFNSSNYCHESDSNGDLFFVVDVDNYSSELINISVADNCTVENDTTNPLINFVSPTEDDESNLSRDYLMVNVSASDDNLENITIYLYDEDSLVDSDTSTISYNFANFTGLSNGTYYFNATAYDSYGNSNSTETRNVVVDVQGNQSNITYPNLTIDFVSPTPAEDVNETYIYVNTSSNGTEHYSFVDFDNDLIGFWRLENNSFIDSSSYGNDGIAVNGSSVVNGKYGNAFSGDGYGRHVAVPDSSSFDSLSVTDEMTVCTWVYPYSNDNSFGNYQAVLGQYMTTGNKKSFGILEGLAGQGVYGLYVSADGSAWQEAYSNSALSLNTWHHLCGAVDSGAIKLYVNGVLQNDNGSAAGIYNADVNFTIGYYYTSSVYYNGSIDEVLLFNRVLSQSEIMAIYNSSAYASFASNYTSLADGNHTFKAYAVNGTEVVYAERTVETGYTEPPANNAPSMNLAIINSSYGNNYTNESLNCYAKANDTDGDNVSYEGFWYKNGEQQGNFSIGGFYEGTLQLVDTLDSSNTSIDDAWSCEIRAYDGENYSSYLLSENLTVLDIPAEDNPAVIYMNSLNFVVTFDANISDDNGIDNVSLFGNWSGIWQEEQTNISGVNNASYAFSKLFTQAGTYSWAFKVYDSIGQVTNSENKTFTLEFI